MVPLLKGTQTSGPISSKEENPRDAVWVPPLSLRNKGSVRRSRAWISAQDDRMKELYPKFKIVFRNSWGIAWKGVVQPAFKKYEILILFIPGCDRPEISIEAQPVSVFVTSGLHRRSEAPDEPIPHRYPCTQFHELCLYHPVSDSWNQYEEYIADDIVFWASQWLLTYEFWHLTGEWVAPGAHPEIGDKERKEEIQKEARHIIPTQKYRRYTYARPLLYHMTYILPPLVITDNGELFREDHMQEIFAKYG